MIKKNIVRTNISRSIYTVYSKINMNNYIPIILFIIIFCIVLPIDLMFYSINYALGRAFAISIILFLILRKTKYNQTFEYFIYKLIKKNKIEYNIIFYNKKIEINNEKMILYEDINELIETDDLLFLKYKNEMIVVDKRVCDYELIPFIREKVNNYRNELGNEKLKLEEEKNVDKTKKINIASILLSILSLILAVLSWNIISMNYPNVLSLTKIWVFLLFIPLPIVSIVICFRENKKRQIIFHLIVIFILFILGNNYNTFNNNFRKDYDFCSKYEKILNIDISKNSDCYQISWDYSKYRFLTSNYILLKNEIKTESDWIIFKDFLELFENYIPVGMLSEANDSCMFKLYFEKYDVYNKIPENPDGNIYIMMYNPTKKFLQIDYYSV